MGLCLCCPVVPTYSKTHSAVAHVPTEVHHPCTCGLQLSPQQVTIIGMVEASVRRVVTPCVWLSGGWGGLFSFLPFGVSPCCPVTD